MSKRHIMSRIKIKNFGPLNTSTETDDGWIQIRKITVFVGNQGSGKSTIAKLISTCVWIEKVLTRGDFKEKEFTASKFRNKYCGYHRISNYFKKGLTEIFYEGDSYNFTYTKEGDFIIKKNTDALSIYPLPQIMYVPAERNFISIVNNPSLINEQAKHSHKMSNDEAKRFEEEVSRIWSDNNFTDTQRRIALSALSAKFNKSAFINIVEEPEQNLFPKSQSLLMQSLLLFNNKLDANKLIITTHSPYLINDLTVAIKVGQLKEDERINDKMKDNINSIYPLASSFSTEDIFIYEHNENKACFSLLDTYNGLPSDENFLNSQLEDSNNRFADLLEIEQQL